MSAVCEVVRKVYPSYSRKEVLEALEIGVVRLRGLTGVLNQLQPDGWDYSPYRRRFSHESFEVLKSFKTLIDDFGEVEAINKIKTICEMKKCLEQQ